MKTRTFFAAGAIFVLSLASAALLFHSSPEPKKAAKAPSSPIAIPADINPNEILTWNCEIPEYKPETILLTCADGGWYLYKIRWNTWDATGATGTGVFSENLCDPNCADGTRVEEQVLITLSTLTLWADFALFTNLEIRTENGNDFWWGRGGNLEWNLMDYILGGLRG